MRCVSLLVLHVPPPSPVKGAARNSPKSHYNLPLERFSLDCRIGIGFGFGFGFTTSFGWLVYLLWFWFYDSQVKTALTHFLSLLSVHDILIFGFFVMYCICMLICICNFTRNRPFARWCHLTTTTRILFVFPFIFKFGNPGEV